MLSNYFKIAFRTLWKNRLFTAINVTGLSLGLASTAVLILFIQRGLTFDAFHKGKDRIYFVQTENKEGRYNQTVFPILGQMLKTFPEIESGTHIQGWSNLWISYKGKDLQGSTRYVDTAFFDVFSFKLKYGNPRTALKEKHSIVLGDRMASALFGNENPLGRSVTVKDTLHFTVTGVLEDLPANSSIQFENLAPIANLEEDKGFASNADWYNTFAVVYLKLRPEARIQALEAKLPAFAKVHFTKDAADRSIRLAPLTEFIHYENPAFKWMIYGAMTIAAFILAIISINLVNLNTAISFTRVKEVAVRKVTGSTLRQIFIQFWTESGVVLVASLLLAAIAAVVYLVPQFNQFREGRMQLYLSWKQDYPTIVALVGIITLIAIIAGTYPVIYLNRLDIRDTIKGRLSGKTHSNGLVRGSLIVVQLVIAFTLVIGAMTVRKQVSFMRQADPGFDPEQVVIVQADLQFKDEELAVAQFAPIMARLREDSRVRSIATSGVVPTKYWTNYNQYQSAEGGGNEVRFKHVGTGPDYASAFGIPMLEGRDFSEALDGEGKNHPVVINASAMKALGWKTAVGRRLRQKNNPEVYTVVGVMQDFHYQGLKDKIEPLLHWYEGPARLNNYLILRLQKDVAAAPLMASLEKEMKQIPSRKPFQWFYLSDEVSRQYNDMDGIWKMVNFVTLLAIIISMAGIFGLITLAAAQRTKEVGIRKTLGANVADLVLLLARDFLVLVAVSVVIGLPLAYNFVLHYLASFEYHTSLPWYTYALVGVAALVLTMLTVSFQSIRAALVNPVKSLRSE